MACDLPGLDVCPWDFPDKNIGVGCHFFLQGIFPTQWSNTSPALAGGFFTTKATWEAQRALLSFSSSVTSDSANPWTVACRLPCPSPSPGVCSNSCPLSHWCHRTISSSVTPISSYLQSFKHQGFFQWVSSLHQVAKVLELQLQPQSFQWIFRVDFL